MLYFANSFLKEEEQQDLRKDLYMSTEWEDGKNTATGTTKEIKRNIQLVRGETFQRNSQYIIDKIKKNNSITNFAFPSDIFQLMFSRTGPGMFYGTHVDLAIINERRRDLSFTIFLNDRNAYKGGELVLYIPPEIRNIKLDAGQIIIYPTKYLHEVKEVTEGERMVCVGWIQSQISNDEDREILGMLRQAQFELQGSNFNSKTQLQLNSVVNRLHKRFAS